MTDASFFDRQDVQTLLLLPKLAAEKCTCMIRNGLKLAPFFECWVDYAVQTRARANASHMGSAHWDESCAQAFP